MGVKKINHIEKTNCMDSLLNSLVVLTLVLGFVVTTTTATARPTTVSHFGFGPRFDNGDDESQESFAHPAHVRHGFFNGFPDFWFGRQIQQPPTSDDYDQDNSPRTDRNSPSDYEEDQDQDQEKEKRPKNEPENDEEEKPKHRHHDKHPEKDEEPKKQHHEKQYKNDEKENSPKQRHHEKHPENKPTRKQLPENQNGRKMPVPTTNSIGTWMVHSVNAGVAAMHIQLMPNNKAVWYDSTSNGISEIAMDPPQCMPRVGGRPTDPVQDCTAHGIEYDIETAEVRTLKVQSSPWCSSGGLSRNGNLISTGGDKDGFRSMRILKPCPDCDIQENTKALYTNRWYATQHPLEDGTFVLVGGRNAYNYEMFPPDTLQFTPKLIGLPLLEETSDDGGRENNLYPFVNLLPDGNLFIFANHKSIILNPYTGETVRRLPDLAGGSRNYPPSGMSALLPIDLNKATDEGWVEVEVIVCGGNTPEAYRLSDLQQPKRTFLDASRNCGRLRVNVEGAEWESEEMPSPRVMGDMLLLPNGQVLMINGAQAGTSAWDAANIPNLTPLLYTPNNKNGERFKEMAATIIPRMYHSVSAVLPDGKILVAGSNTNAFYKLQKYNDHFTFPTELRVEKFSPPYLAPELDAYRLAINEDESDKKLKYGSEFTVAIELKEFTVGKEDIKVTMYSPPFTTHGYSMNQRLLILKVNEVQGGRITVVAPQTGKLAPPGYYLVFVVHGDVPSRGMWVHIE